MVNGEIGRIIAAIHEKRFECGTIIIFTSDHGEGMAHHQNVREYVSYDEALKVPLIISSPELQGGRRMDSVSLVTGMDILPTMCDYAGIERPAMIRGRSLRGILEGKAENSPAGVVLELTANNGRIVRSQRYKYVVFHEDPIEQLLDMLTDPGELVNLASLVEYTLDSR